MNFTKLGKKRRGFICLLLFFLIGGGLSWYLLSPKAVIRNVVLISIDTCRADHLSCYGFGRPTTPTIDKIADQGLLFKNAHSPIPLTLPAHCSMLTGTYPIYHQVRDNLDYKLSESNLTLPEILQEHGYAAGAVISAVVLNKKYGIGQGFDIYHDIVEPQSGPDMNVDRLGEDASRLACEFLADHRNQPFFLFLHYFDPHYIYGPPEPFASQYADDLYSGEIAYTDQCISLVMEQLKNLGLYDSTLILIVGDHGEGLTDHGESEHGYFLYQSTVHVPFIIRAPGKNPPKVIPDSVSLVDVVPTILGYLGLPIPDHIQGHDLSVYAESPPPSGAYRYVFAESLIATKYGCNPLLAVMSGRWNYIHTNRPELYDLVEDPRQLTNLAQNQDQRARLLQSYIQEMLIQMAPEESADSRLALDEQSRKLLESLGYVGRVKINDNLELNPAHKDAKDMISCHEYISEGAHLITEGKFDEAKKIGAKIIAQWPEVPNSYEMLLRIAHQTDQPSEVIEYGRMYLDRYLEINRKRKVDLTILAENLTHIYGQIVQAAIKLERFDLVAEFCRLKLQLSPDDPDVLTTLAMAYFRQGRHDQAFEIWNQTLQLHPRRPEIYGDMGLAFYQLGDLNQAAAYLEKALQLNPNLLEVQKILNNILQLKQLEQDITQYSEMIRRRPDDPALHGKIALAFYQKGAHQQASEHWRQAIRLKPDWPEPYNNLAGLLATSKNPQLHDPAEALLLAQRAAEMTNYQVVEIMETLSVAYAANKKYAQAINTAEKALKIAISTKNLNMTEKLRQHLNLFRAKQKDR